MDGGGACRKRGEARARISATGGETAVSLPALCIAFGNMLLPFATSAMRAE